VIPLVHNNSAACCGFLPVVKVLARSCQHYLQELMLQVDDDYDI